MAVICGGVPTVPGVSTSGNKPKALNELLVATNTLPLATSGADHFAAKSSPSRLFGACVLLYSSMPKLEASNAWSTPGIGTRGASIRSIAHRMPLSVPLAEGRSVAPGKFTENDDWDVGVVDNIPLVTWKLLMWSRSALK